jgi:hypothetical protein
VAEYRNVSIDGLICFEEVLLLELLSQILDNDSVLLVFESIINSWISSQAFGCHLNFRAVISNLTDIISQYNRTKDFKKRNNHKLLIVQSKSAFLNQWMKIIASN